MSVKKANVGKSTPDYWGLLNETFTLAKVYDYNTMEQSQESKAFCEELRDGVREYFIMRSRIIRLLEDVPKEDNTEEHTEQNKKGDKKKNSYRIMREDLLDCFSDTGWQGEYRKDTTTKEGQDAYRAFYRAVESVWKEFAELKMQEGQKAEHIDLNKYSKTSMKIALMLNLLSRYKNWLEKKEPPTRIERSQNNEFVMSFLKNIYLVYQRFITEHCQGYQDVAWYLFERRYHLKFIENYIHGYKRDYNIRKGDYTDLEHHIWFGYKLPLLNAYSITKANSDYLKNNWVEKQKISVCSKLSTDFLHTEYILTQNDEKNRKLAKSITKKEKEDHEKLRKEILGEISEYIAPIQAKSIDEFCSRLNIIYKHRDKIFKISYDNSKEYKAYINKAKPNISFLLKNKEYTRIVYQFICKINPEMNRKTTSQKEKELEEKKYIKSILKDS